MAQKTRRGIGSVRKSLPKQPKPKKKYKFIKTFEFRPKDLKLARRYAGMSCGQMYSLVLDQVKTRLSKFDPDEISLGVEAEFQIKLQNRIALDVEMSIDENWDDEDTYDVVTRTRVRRISDMDEVTYTEKELQDVIAEGFLLDA